MNEGLTEQIKQAAAEPAAATVDGVTVTQRPLSELVTADQHISQKTAASRPRQALRPMRVVPPGSI